jgi:predicted nuclease of restriction endonuclease-like (RecB) superfamily
MKQFYVAYSNPEIWQQAAAKLKKRRGDERPIWQQAVAKLDNGSTVVAVPNEILMDVPWGHHLLIMNKMMSQADRLYYLRATAQFGWSRNVLLNQINAKAHERARELKSHNFPAVLPAHLAEQADEALKSSYNLEFLGIAAPLRELELERRLIERVRDLILELGYGFCFIGNQYRLTLGKNEYFIDLLFYHRFLKSLVAVDLKTGKFKPEYAGKMDFYLNLLNEKEKGKGDNPSVGIILCAEKDRLEVEFSLKSKTNPIGVAEYRLYRTLPKEMRGKLPSVKELTEGIRRELKR